MDRGFTDRGSSLAPLSSLLYHQLPRVVSGKGLAAAGRDQEGVSGPHHPYTLNPFLGSRAKTIPLRRPRSLKPLSNSQ